MNLGDRHGRSKLTQQHGGWARNGRRSRARARRAHGQDLRCCCMPARKPRQQLVTHRGIVDAGDAAVAHDGAAGDDDFVDVARGRSREQEVRGSRSGRRRSSSTASQSSSRMSAGMPGASGRRHPGWDGSRPFANAMRSIDGRSTSIRKPAPACRRCASRISRSASSSSSSVEAVETERDPAAAAHHLRQRCDAGTQSRDSSWC